MTNQESLIVASKVKNFIREESGMNSSSEIISVLSTFVQQKCLQAVDRAKKQRRKTVMARDFEEA